MQENNLDIRLANIQDKIELCKKRNKIQNTCFFSQDELILISKRLNLKMNKNISAFGGFEDAERKILLIFNEKYSIEMVLKNIAQILKVVQIKLPRDLYKTYTHSDYLGMLMKLGLERERFGDIMCFEDEAYVFVLHENAEYIKENLKKLTRLKSAEINIIEYTDAKIKSKEFENLRITISSERLDNFVAELARCSRNKAEEYLLNEKVLVNGIVETKSSKNVKVGDIITIRSRGKFIVKSFSGENKKERKIFEIQKYC